LSQESHHVGFALSSVSEEQRLRKLEFISLGGTRVLVVTVAEDGQITQKVVDAGEALTSEDLRRAAEYVNREFSGQPIDAVRTAILARLHAARGLYDDLMAQAFALAERALSARSGQQALFVDGTASLIAEAQQQHGESRWPRCARWSR